MYDLPVGLIDSLGPSAVGVDAIGAACRLVHDRETIDIDVLRPCVIAGTIVGLYAHSCYGPETDYVSVELKAEAPSKGTVRTATRRMHNGQDPTSRLPPRLCPGHQESCCNDSLRTRHGLALKPWPCVIPSWACASESITMALKPPPLARKMRNATQRDPQLGWNLQDTNVRKVKTSGAAYVRIGSPTRT